MCQKLKTGFFIGKFLPPHIGHVSQIEKCLNQVDILYVIVADSRGRTLKICKDAGLKAVSVNKRLKWLKRHFKNNQCVKFLRLSQGMLEAYPNDIDVWKNKLSKTLCGRSKCWFVDNEFLERSRNVFPEYEFIGFDRTKVNISATMVRENLKENISNIIPEAKNYFKKYLK